MGSRPSHFTLTSPGPLRLYSTSELLAMPPPHWLVDNIMPAGGLVGLYGQPGSKKSFIAIDLALCVATGIPWQGHEVEQNFVVYISAEGNAGIGKRVLAWLVNHEILENRPHIGWLIESIPVNADSEQMTQLIDRIADEVQTKPGLIVIDTVARCFDGNENEQEDMGRFVAGIDWLRFEFQCTVLAVHHTNVAGIRERGNTAFRGAADTMLSVEGPDDLVTITCNKQKDAEEFEPIELEIQQIPGTDSCVLKPNSAVVSKQEQATLVLETLRSIQPAKWDDWLESTGLNRSQFAKVYAGIKKQRLATRGQGGLWTVNSAAENPIR